MRSLSVSLHWKLTLTGRYDVRGSGPDSVFLVQSYANLGGNSDVLEFENGTGFIVVKFRDSSIYVYTNQSAGATNILTMQGLGDAGVGLNSFIDLTVYRDYESKS